MSTTSVHSSSFLFFSFSAAPFSRYRPSSRESLSSPTSVSSPVAGHRENAVCIAEQRRGVCTIARQNFGGSDFAAWRTSFTANLRLIHLAPKEASTLQPPVKLLRRREPEGRDSSISNLLSSRSKLLIPLVEACYSQRGGSFSRNSSIFARPVDRAA